MLPYFGTEKEKFFPRRVHSTRKKVRLDLPSFWKGYSGAATAAGLGAAWHRLAVCVEAAGACTRAGPSGSAAAGRRDELAGR